MSKCYTYNGKTYKQDELIEVAIQEINSGRYPLLASVLFKADNSVSAKLNRIQQEGKGLSFSPKYIGVNKYIDMERYYPGSTTLYRLCPAYDELNRINNCIQLEIEKNNLSYEEAKAKIEDQIKEEKLNSGLGDIIHNLIYLGFKFGFETPEYMAGLEEGLTRLNKQNQDGKSLFDLITSEGSGNSTPEDVINLLSKTARKIVLDLKAEYPDAEFYPEFEMKTEKALVEGFDGIVGKADLVIKTKDDQIIIYDYKTSSKQYDDWSAAKQYHTDYQLGFYRQILAANGVDVSKAKLIVKPIFYKRTDIGTILVQPDENRTASMINGIKHLDYTSGKFSLNIAELIPVPTQIEISNPSELQQKISDDLSCIFPAYDTIKDVDKDNLIEQIYIDTNHKPGQTQYKFHDWMSDRWIYRDSKEEFTQEGGEIDKFIEKYRQYHSKRIYDIIEAIKNAQNKGLSSTDIDFLTGKKSSNPKVPIALQNVLGRYCDPSFTILDNDILLDNNILAFEKNGVVEFVYLSTNQLDKQASINDQSTVLGKFLSNDEARRLQGMKVLNSYYGNLEMIKVLSILNSIKNNNSEFLNGKKIGIIQILNPDQGFPWVENIQAVKQNFSFLCTKTNREITDVISNQEMSNPWEFIVQELKTISQSLQVDDKLKVILSGINSNQVDLQDRIEAMRKLLLKLRDYDPNLKSTKIESGHQLDLQKPAHQAYKLLADAYNYYHGIELTPDGKISKYGLHLSEIIKLLGMPFIKDQSNVLNNGITSSGLLNGTYMSSPQTIQSEALRSIYRYYDAAYLSLREAYLDQRMRIQEITKKYIASKKSSLDRILINDTINIWENFLEKDQNGKISHELKLKNPYSPKCDLTPEDKEFLKEILWEINKFQLHLTKHIDLTYKKDHAIIDAIPEVQEAITTEKYFYLPLRRAQAFQKLKKLGSIGVTNAFKAWWENLKDDYDPRLLHNYQQHRINSQIDKDSVKMYNQYDLNTTERNHYLQSESSPYNFEFDLDLLASDVAFQSIRKRFFEDVLILTETVSTAMHFSAQTGGKDYAEELETLAAQTGVSITNKPQINTEWQDTAKVVGAAKRLNSLVVLAVRPLQFLKELTFGQITNYSRAWALKGMSGEISVKSVFEANKIIWGQSFRKYGNTFAGEGDIADFTMCSSLNKEYGFANEDLNRLVENSTLQATGLSGNLSKWMYIANSAPDYFNRLCLFIAKMIEDGCWEAHSLDEKGNLVYDFTKDKRFSKLNKLGLNSNSQDKEYLQQKGLYYAMVDEFEKDGYKLKKWNSETKSYNLVPLPRAYTTKQRNAIKEVADLAYGFYDHEAKSLIDHKIFGLVWKQFMTFWTGKTTLWFRGRPTNAGDNTSQGRYVPATKDGKTLYRKYVIGPDNQLITVQLVTEDDPDFEEGLEVQYQWQGDYVEGLLYSIGHTLYDIFHADWNDLRNNKTQLANLKLALHDILMGILLYTLLKWIFSEGSNKMQDVHPTGRVLLRAMQDVGPQSIGQLDFEPGFYTTLQNFKTDFAKLLTTDPDFQKIINSRIGSFKDFNWNMND